MRKREEYRNKPEDCDAAAPRVGEFRSLRDRALELLEYDAQSIGAQLSELFWQDATFRVFNFARRFSTRGNGNASAAGLLANYLDTAYVTREVNEIARLLERPSDVPEKGVVSLPSIIKLVRDGSHLITRDVYVSHDGLPYDYEAANRTEFERLLKRSRPGRAEWRSTDTEVARIAHETFDRLSGKRPSQRRPDDKVKPGVFRWLERHLVCEEAAKFLRLRRKVFAHSADSTSRGASWQREGISLNDADVVHRRLLEVAEVLALIVSGPSIVPVAIAQFDVLHGLDRPFVLEENKKDLYEFWSSYTSDRETWSRYALDAAPCKSPLLKGVGGASNLLPDHGAD